MTTPSLRLGVDLGGTKIAGIALGPDGNIQASARVPTPRGRADGIVRAVADLVARLEREAGAGGTLGIGTPGSISPVTGLLRNSNTTELNGFPLREALAAATGRPVRIANDADCFALSEAIDGAGAGARIVFGVIAGTGVGGGIVANGTLLTGANGIAGEWGHNPLPWPVPGEGRDDGPACYCGKRGCIETFLSGPGIAADHARHHGEPCDAGLLVAQGLAGDDRARATLARFHDRFARALAAVINLLDPDVVVLGGGVSNIGSLYEELPQRLPRYVFSDALRTRIVPARFGDSSGVRGAAWLWND